jgi:nucleoside-diphosphate kinase
LERTFVIIKPDAVQRGLIGEIIGRLEKRGLRLVAAKFMLVDRPLAEAHYAVHVGKPFYAGLVNYITSSPIVAMVWEGLEAIAAVRQTMGKTNPLEAAPGTIRHDFALGVSRNLGSSRKNWSAGIAMSIPGCLEKIDLILSQMKCLPPGWDSSPDFYFCAC